jgi:hypothetical protein
MRSQKKVVIAVPLDDKTSNDVSSRFEQIKNDYLSSITSRSSDPVIRAYCIE